MSSPMQLQPIYQQPIYQQPIYQQPMQIQQPIQMNQNSNIVVKGGRGRHFGCCSCLICLVFPCIICCPVD